MTDIVAGDTWTLTNADGLGTGVGSIPTGAEVVVDSVLPPFSPGVAQVDENVVRCTFTFADYIYSDGVLVEGENSRTLAFCESDFLALFTQGVVGP